MGEYLAGCSKSSSSKAAAREEANAYSVRYVEPLSKARTPLTGFFSILLGVVGLFLFSGQSWTIAADGPAAAPPTSSIEEQALTQVTSEDESVREAAIRVLIEQGDASGSAAGGDPRQCRPQHPAGHQAAHGSESLFRTLTYGP